MLHVLNERCAIFMVFKVAHWKRTHWTHYLEGWHFTLTPWHEMLYCWGQCGLRLELEINSDTYLITIYHSRWDNTTRYSVFPWKTGIHIRKLLTHPVMKWCRNSVFPSVHRMWQWKTGIHIRKLLTHPVRRVKKWCRNANHRGVLHPDATWTWTKLKGGSENYWLWQPLSFKYGGCECWGR